jgi:hypothetical protein
MKAPVLIVNQFMECIGRACILPIDTSEPVNARFNSELSDAYAKVRFGRLVRYSGFMLYLAEKGQTLQTGTKIGNEPCRKEIGFTVPIEKRSLVMIPPGIWHVWLKK